MTQKTALVQHQQALLELLEEFDRVCKALDIPYMLFAGSLLGAVRHQGFIPWDDDLDVVLLRSDYQRLLQSGETVLNQERFFLQKEFSDHWPMFFSKLRLNGTACLEKYHPKDPQSHQGVYLDIFPCDAAAKTELGRRLQFFSSKVVIAKSLYKRGYATGSKKKWLFMELCRFLPGKPFWHIVKRDRGDTPLVHTFFGAASSYQKNVYPRSWFTQTRQASFAGREIPISAEYDALLTALYGDYQKLPPESDRKCKEHALLVDLTRSYEEYTHYRDGMILDDQTRSIR